MPHSTWMWLIPAFAAPVTAVAQFFTPLPAPLPAHIVRMESYGYGLDGYLGSPSADSVAVLLGSTEGRAFLQGNIIEFCRDSQPAEFQDDCNDVLSLENLAKRKNKRILPDVYHRHSLPFAWPWASHSKRNRDVLVKYLKSANASTDLSVFNQFAANVTSKTAYVTTDVISGLALGTLVGIQYAAVVVKDSNQEVDRRQLVEDNTATTMRMINNGGTVTVRMLYPMWAGGGTNGQHAMSFYFTGGVIGPIGTPDSLRLALSGVVELMNGFAIRGLGSEGDVRGEVVVGIRGGVGWSEHELLPDTKRKSLPFAQLALGLRQNGRLGLSLLYTFLGDNTVFRPYAPKFIVNFSALR